MKTLDQPTEQKLNEEHFLEILRAMNPQLYLIKIALDETSIDPMVIPQIVRLLGNLTLGAGYGRVQIYMQAKVITDIESTEKVRISEK